MAAQNLESTSNLVVSETSKSLEASANESVQVFGSGLKMEPKLTMDEEKRDETSVRAEIDTSAPFESVKEAVSRFGGIGFWRPNSHKTSQVAEHDTEVVDITKVEEQAAQLEKDLIVKERQTFEVLKELETTKIIVEELKLKLQKEASEVNVDLNTNSDDKNVNTAVGVVEKESLENIVSGHQNSLGGLDLCPSSAPGFILMELKRAKLNLTQTTNDLADIRATVESYNKEIEKERISLEKTRKRLSSNSLKISSLEEELNQTKLKLQLSKDDETKVGSDISRELQHLISETQQFKKIGEAAKSEVLRAMYEIEQTKTSIKTSEMRLVAARKMKEAARATEAVALAEIKALSSSEDSSGSGVTLSFEEYSSLTAKAREAEEASKKRVTDAMLQVDNAYVSKTEILKRVEEATEVVKISKKTLEEALSSVEAANRGKLAVEEALRNWRSDHGRKRSSVQNSTKFKNSYPSHLRKDSHLVDVNGSNLVNDEAKPVLKPTLSIGQILSRKLFLTEEFENGMHTSESTVKVSLGQMLNKPNGDLLSARKGERESGGHKQQLPAKRKKFGFARISLLVTKQSKKKKKQTPSSWCRSALI